MSTIRLEKKYPVPKEILWRYLTEDALLSAWCMPTKYFALEKGKEFIFKSASSIFWDGRFYNTILGFSENTYLTYKCTSRRPKLNTVVKWMLAEANGETTLVLEHSDFRISNWLTKIMLAVGWKKMMDTHLYQKLLAHREYA